MFRVIPTEYVITGELCPGDLVALFTAPRSLQESWSAGDDIVRSRLRKRHDAAVSIAVAAAMEVGLIPLETYVQPSRFALESHLDLPTLNAREEVAIRNAADEIGDAYRAALQA